MKSRLPTEPDFEPEQESHPEPGQGVEMMLALKEPEPGSETELMPEEPGASTRRTSGPAIAREKTTSARPHPDSASTRGNRCIETTPTREQRDHPSMADNNSVHFTHENNSVTFQDNNIAKTIRCE